MGLDLKYRPRRFGEVAGQQYTRAVLHAMCRKGTVPSALLFYGMPGSGKTSSARIVASALNCTEAPGAATAWPCTRCDSCRAVIGGTSLDVIEIDAASNGSVDRIRELQERLQYCTPGKHRVVILDEAHSMGAVSYNALLKLIEEPPDSTVFVLCTTEPGKVLSTVRSRCSPYEFTALPVSVIKSRLSDVCELEAARTQDPRGWNMEEKLLYKLADQANGIMRNGLKLLDQAAAVGIVSLDDWLKLTGDQDYAPGIIARAASGHHALLFEALDEVLMTHSDYPAITASLVGCLKDILVLQSGGLVAAQGRALEARESLARSLEAYNVVMAMRVLWDLQTKVRTEDRRAGLQLAVVMLAEKLSPRQAAPVPAGNGNSHRLVSVSELAGMPGFVPA